MTSVAELQVFRNRAYGLLGNGRDVLFDLMDSVITSRKLPSFAEVSLSPRFRRQWPSLYKTLERSEPSADKLMRLYTDYLPKGNRLVLAGDHTAWPRLWSPTLKERTYEHQPEQQQGGDRAFTHRPQVSKPAPAVFYGLRGITNHSSR